jgi:hypothetical protein
MTDALHDELAEALERLHGAATRVLNMRVHSLTLSKPNLQPTEDAAVALHAMDLASEHVRAALLRHREAKQNGREAL